MVNTKIPAGYQGTYAKAAVGSPVLVMVSKSESIAGNKPANKEKSMSDENKKYVPYTTEQKKEYAKQFTPNEIKSYRKGQRSAYAHMGNIGRRNSFFIYDNLKKDETTAPVTQCRERARAFAPFLFSGYYGKNLLSDLRCRGARRG